MYATEMRRGAARRRPGVIALVGTAAIFVVACSATPPTASDPPGPAASGTAIASTAPPTAARSRALPPDISTAAPASPVGPAEPGALDWVLEPPFTPVDIGVVLDNENTVGAVVAAAG